MAPCTYEIPPGYEHEILELPSEYGKRKQINQDSTWQLQTVPCFKPVDTALSPVECQRSGRCVNNYPAIILKLRLWKLIKPIFIVTSKWTLPIFGCSRPTRKLTFVFPHEIHCPSQPYWLLNSCLSFLLSLKWGFIIYGQCDSESRLHLLVNVTRRSSVLPTTD